MPAETRDQAVGRLRELFSPERCAERRRRMTPEQRALDERITRRRDEIGPIDFDIVAALREMRNGG